jgi:dihydrofolate reductase
VRDAPTITLVVAVARNGVIGSAGDMPWRMPSSLRRFRELTMGRPMIMGRKTFEAIGRPLDGRDTIVVTRRRVEPVTGVHYAHDLSEAFGIASRLARARGVDEIIIAGGGEVYRAALPYAHRVHVDLIDAEPAGDTTFPDLPADDWRETSRTPIPHHLRDQYAAMAITYERLHRPLVLPES